MTDMVERLVLIKLREILLIPIIAMVKRLEVIKQMVQPQQVLINMEEKQGFTKKIHPVELCNMTATVEKFKVISSYSGHSRKFIRGLYKSIIFIMVFLLGKFLSSAKVCIDLFPI